MQVNMDITFKGPMEIENFFEESVWQVLSDERDKVLRYHNLCRKKYHGIMTEALIKTRRSLEDYGIKSLVNSSYSADVYIDSPGDVDVDIVIPVDDSVNKDYVKSCLRVLGFTFLETRNLELKTWTHDVYIKKYDQFVIEIKIREWKYYKDHLYKIHTYLDSLDSETRMAWRYLRMIASKKEQSKKMKYLWYVYGAIKSGVDTNPKEFPMNIFY